MARHSRGDEQQPEEHSGPRSASDLLREAGYDRGERRRRRRGDDEPTTAPPPEQRMMFPYKREERTAPPAPAAPAPAPAYEPPAPAYEPPAARFEIPAPPDSYGRRSAEGTRPPVAEPVPSVPPVESYRPPQDRPRRRRAAEPDDAPIAPPSSGGRRRAPEPVEDSERTQLHPLPGRPEQAPRRDLDPAAARDPRRAARDLDRTDGGARRELDRPAARDLDRPVRRAPERPAALDRPAARDLDRPVRRAPQRPAARDDRPGGGGGGQPYTGRPTEPSPVARPQRREAAATHTSAATARVELDRPDLDQISWEQSRARRAERTAPPAGYPLNYAERTGPQPVLDDDEPTRVTFRPVRPSREPDHVAEPKRTPPPQLRERARPVEDVEDDEYDEIEDGRAERGPLFGWLMFLVETVVAAGLGLGLWIGFHTLWRDQPYLAAIGAGAIIVGLHAGAGWIRRKQTGAHLDVFTSAVVVAVAVAITVLPAAFALKPS